MIDVKIKNRSLHPGRVQKGSLGIVPNGLSGISKKSGINPACFPFLRFFPSPMRVRPCARLLLMAVFSLVLSSACTKENNRVKLASRLAEEDGIPADSPDIKNLENKIQQVEDQLAKTIKAVQDEGTYWRTLGLKYMDYKMWGKAAEAFDEALKIYPDYAVLQYNRALCISRLALSALTEDKRSGYMDQAEAGHRRALEIMPKYTPAMYALAVIMLYERNDSAEAARILDRFIQIEKTDIPARFLLVQALIASGRSAEALAVCDDIARMARREEDRQRADMLARQIGETG